MYNTSDFNDALGELALAVNDVCRITGLKIDQEKSKVNHDEDGGISAKIKFIDSDICVSAWSKREQTGDSIEYDADMKDETTGKVYFEELKFFDVDALKDIATDGEQNVDPESHEYIMKNFI
jgi:hypothetical protein